MSVSGLIADCKEDMVSTMKRSRLFDTNDVS